MRYIVGHGTAERVQETTALPHRMLEVEQGGDVIVYLQRPSNPGASGQIVHMISAAELQLLAREHRREMRRRFWARVLGRRRSGKRTEAHLRHAQMENAVAIRRHVGPMRNEDGSLNVSAVAQEATLREQTGLPSYIAELDGPGKVT